MEPHPPLGKMLIALGEVIVDANPVDNQMLNNDYEKTMPEEFSFAGYRLIPVLMMWLTAALMFWIFFLIAKDWFMATMLSFLYIFDNALIVHNRGAMLDAPMIFFCAAMMLLFLLMLHWKEKPKPFKICALLYGVSLGLVMATKVLGLIMILLAPSLLLGLYPKVRQWLRFLGIAAAGFLVAYVGVWYVHFSIAHNINPALQEEGFYQASDAYKLLLFEGKTRSPLAFPTMWKDSMKYLRHYSGGVPQLDLCKPNENGSPFFLWPIGGRTINYRWESKGADAYGYLYLVPNPIAWLAGLLGVILSAALLLSSVIHPLKSPLRHRYLLSVFLGLYISYMVAVSQIHRVMYLYHYFIPLLISFVLFALVCMEVRTLGKWNVSEHARGLMMVIFGLLVFGAFQIYRPFTYNLPLTSQQFEHRNLLRLWDMHCIGCERNKMLAEPRTCDAQS